MSELLNSRPADASNARRPVEVVHRVRMSQLDAHYGGNLVDGARILQLFGDVSTELMIRLNGDEGLLAAYEELEFLSPTYAGDFLEVRATLLEMGRTSRKVAVFAQRYIRSSPESDSAADLMDEAVPVCRGVMVAVVPADRQR
jgi:3-aminobutyryl-CoA ammonia-lyase